MVNLSVNVNKVALLRNSRNLNVPNVLWAVKTAIEAGADGITIHPRPDERHIRKSDAYQIAKFLREYSKRKISLKEIEEETTPISENTEYFVEYNIEGNPFIPPFMEIVRDVRPTQCTLVPDNPDTFTSDHGWNLNKENIKRLIPLIEELHSLGCRVSLFMDPEKEEIPKAKDTGADRIELYTEPYARAYAKFHHTGIYSDSVKNNTVTKNSADFEKIFQKYETAAITALKSELGINAGHDLNLDNLGDFIKITGISEVSIGHALISDAIRIGLYNAVQEYLHILQVRS